MSALFIPAVIAYVAGMAYTHHRLRRVERYYGEAAPVLLWLAVIVTWPTTLPVIIITTRKDPIP